MDLLAAVWPRLDEAGRQTLSAAIIAGPPESLLNQAASEPRERSRDRRIYDRIAILERCEVPPLTDAPRAEMERLRAAYPAWRASEGERAHFTSWMDMRWGPDTNYSVQGLITLEVSFLLDTLVGEKTTREGLLDSWRQLAVREPAHALELLEMLSARESIGPSEVWQYGHGACEKMPTATRLSAG
jgi:hypothetical protein